MVVGVRRNLFIDNKGCSLTCYIKNVFSFLSFRLGHQILNHPTNAWNIVFKSAKNYPI